MATVGGYSRHKMLDETNSELYTNAGDGATPLVYSPLEQKDRIKANLNMQVAVTGGAARFTMPAPATATGTATLTAAQLLTGLVLGTPAAVASYTLPTGTDLDLALPTMQVGEAFEFVIVNLSTTAANDITVVTNTGLTLVGELVIEANEATQLLPSQGTFWARKTGTATYSIYRVGS